MILFIGESQKIADEFRTAIEFPFGFNQVSSVKEAALSCDREPREDPFAPIIILDATHGTNAISACRSLRQDPHFGAATILVLLAEQRAREKILAAGADDILLHPYVPAEIKYRLCKYLELCFLQCVNSKTSQALGEGTSGKHFIIDVLGVLNRSFCASGAWLYFFCQQGEDVRLLDFQIPGSLDDREFDRDWVTAALRAEALRKSSTIETITLPTQATHDHQLAPHLGSILSVPLCRQQNEIIGSLYLRFADAIQLSDPYTQLFSTLGRHMIGLMAITIHLMRGETSTAFTGIVGLISKTICQETDTQPLVSHTLDQTVALLNASMGCVWMKDDGGRLEMISSLSASPIQYTPLQIDSGRGLIGSVAKSGRAIRIDTPHEHPDFDPIVDQWHGSPNHSVLAVPMQSGEKVLGVLALYHDQNEIITDQDVAVVESIAGLCASRITSIDVIRGLREYSNQLQALYEMSQHIALGLDLATVLNRTLQWVLRLVESEIGLLWLIDEQDTELKLVATLGMELLNQKMVSIPSDQEPFKGVIDQGVARLVDFHTDDLHSLSSVRNLLGIDPRNFVLLPILYHGGSIGVLGLVNKVGGTFLDSEMGLLLTAVDMIAIAVGNARLHSQTLDLMDEREQAHAAAIQRTRLATMGRLTASLSHEINNPMQAIRGALALAMEDIDDQESLVEYLNMCMQESDRVVQMIDRMRRIYRPSSKDPQSIHINDTLEEICTIVEKESSRQGVALRTELTPNVPEVTANVDQLHIVFLNLALSLSDAIAESGGGELTLRSLPISTGVCVEFKADQVVPNWERAIESGTNHAPTELGISVTICREIIHSLEGAMELIQSDNASILSIMLPARVERQAGRVDG